MDDLELHSLDLIVEELVKRHVGFPPVDSEEQRERLIYRGKRKRGREESRIQRNMDV